MSPKRRPDFEVPADWPNRSASVLLEQGDLRWHWQRLGAGPPLLLLHGAGASTHSFRDLAPRLAERFDVLAPDLPGLGYSRFMGPVRRIAMPEIGSALGTLLERIGFEPKIIVGHSAGAAILARMTLDRRVHPDLFVGLNPALLPMRGMAARILPSVARIATASSLGPRLMAWASDERRVDQTLRGIGSRLDREGIRLYTRLAQDPVHVEGTVAMMAAWDLAPLVPDLPGLTAPALFVVGSRDAAVAPGEARAVAARLPSATVEVLEGLGHLAHEEAPDRTAKLVFEHAVRVAR